MRIRWIALPVIAVAALFYLLWPTDDHERADRGPDDQATPPDRLRSEPGVPSAPEAPTEQGERPTPAADHVVWTVRIIGPHDQPIGGLLLILGPPLREHITDATGRASTSAPRYTTDLSVRFPSLGIVRPVRAPETVIRLGHLVRVDLAWIDAPNGERISGGDVEVLEAGRGAITLPRRDSGIYSHGVAGETMRFRVNRAPDGYGVADSQVRNLGPISRYAKSVLVSVPIWPEIDLIVRATWPDGSPAMGAAICGVRLAGRAIPTRANAAGDDGRIRTHGVPFLRGERLSVDVAGKKGGDTWHGGAETLLDQTKLDLGVSLATPGNLIGLGGGAGGGRRGRGGRRGYPPAGSGILEIEVVRSNGSPAHHARVRIRSKGESWTVTRSAHTDARGILLFRNVPSATYAVTVEEPGFVFTSNEIRVGRTALLILREPRGWTALVRVVDAAGKPAPGARLRVFPEEGPEYVLLEEGVQVMQILTDAYGEARLPHLPHCKAQVRATLGSRKAEARIAEGSGAALLTLSGRR